MPIKINVPYPERNAARDLGARWNSDEKSWIIPDSVTEINPFQKWLPKQEGYLVKRPYALLKAKRFCWKCTAETPLIALAARSYYAPDYHKEPAQSWKHCEDPIIFTGITEISPEILDLLTEKYPFFRFTFSKTIGSKYWANTCMHCKALQGDNYNFMMPPAPFFHLDPAKGTLIERENLILKFDYYITAGEVLNATG